MKLKKYELKDFDNGTGFILRINKIKIIDLLNKIANGEEVPKKIKYRDEIYEYQHRRDTKNSFNYICSEKGEYLSRRYFIDNILTDEIEVLEEKKMPEKLDKYADISGDLAYDWTFGEKKLKDKINEIIDYLKSKGE